MTARRGPALVLGVATLAIAGNAVGSPAAPGGARANPCTVANEKLDRARAKLQRLVRNEASAAEIRRARQKVKKAKQAAKDICQPPPVIYDITAASSKFDATWTRTDIPDCTYVKDAHWTSTLAPGAGKSSFELYTYDNQGRPIYIFSGPVNGFPMTSHGTGTATMECPEGRTVCTFDVRPAYDSLTLSSDAEASRDPMTMNWYLGFNSFGYTPQDGGRCSYSGPFPPEISPSDYSPGLFVNRNTEGATTALDYDGINTTPVSTFGETASLQISGAGSTEYGLDASWEASVTLQRR